MRAQASDSAAAWPAEVSLPSGVLVTSGYGVDIRVWRGRLRVAGGIGKQRPEVAVHRATGRLRRLVVLGHTGSVSLEAIRWLADVGAGFVQLDADGRLLAAFGPVGTDRPGLRRAQARALDTPTGNGIVRRLLAEKVAAQARTLVAVERYAAVRDDVVGVMRAAAEAIHDAETRDELRGAEARAAVGYWSAWSAVPVLFARRDVGIVPQHWRAFGTRTSPLTGSPRLAANPANAVLNYLYALLEGEASIAARIVGLDPGLGLLHADQLNRDSLAADLMEPVRPHVDRFALRLLCERSFAATDFYETRQGVCRIMPPLAAELASTTREWLRLVGRVAEDVAVLLEARAEPGRPTPTPITESNRAGGHPRCRPRRPDRGPTVELRCTSCGGPTPEGRRTCSEACEQEAAAVAAKAYAAAGAERLRRMRAAGWTPVMTKEGRERLGLQTAERVRSAREWQSDHRWPDDPDYFADVIRPSLAGVSLREMQRATGLSYSYLSRIKSGKVVPHPMWWGVLSALGGRPEASAGK